MSEGIKITDLKESRKETYKKQGGLDGIRQDFKDADTIVKLKNVLKKIFKAQGIFDVTD